MTTLRQNQLKQLNYLDKAISYLSKALTVGEKQEELGYNNGKIAVRAKELLDIYNEQFSIQNTTEAEYDGPSDKHELSPRQFKKEYLGEFDGVNDYNKGVF